jgi:hypothetical protein
LSLRVPIIDYAASSLETIATGHVMALQHALELVTEHWLLLLPDVAAL